MASAGDFQNRCVNCAIRIQRNVLRQSISEMTENLRELLRVWISCELNPDDAVCGNCYNILTESIQTTNYLRRFGYRNVCIPCGSSILRSQRCNLAVDTPERNIIMADIPEHLMERLDQVCKACWLSVSRTVRRNRRQIENSIEIPPMDSDNNDIPPPTSTPEAVSFPVPQQNIVQSITLPSYKRAAATSRTCIFKLCQNKSRLLVPKFLKEMLLLDHSFYVPRCCRVCEYHLIEPHNDWHALFTNSNCSDFSADQIEDIFAILKSSVNRRMKKSEKRKLKKIIKNNSTSTIADSSCSEFLFVST